MRLTIHCKSGDMFTSTESEVTGEEKEVIDEAIKEVLKEGYDNGGYFSLVTYGGKVWVPINNIAAITATGDWE